MKVLQGGAVATRGAPHDGAPAMTSPPTRTKRQLVLNLPVGEVTERHLHVALADKADASVVDIGGRRGNRRNCERRERTGDDDELMHVILQGIGWLASLLMAARVSRNQ